MSKNLVVKDNSLINASYNLELVEQRIILLAILKIWQIGNPEMWMPFDSQIEIYADDYAKAFGTTRQASYIALKEACKTLFNRQFSYQEIDKNGKNYTVTARWVSRIFYADDEASVKLDFTHYVIPLVTELEKHFTSYELEQVAGLNSKYAIRLYENIIAWRSKEKTPMITVEEIRNRLGVQDNEYKLIADFKKRVLDFAVNQINEHTDIILSYEQHKKGRLITGFTFSFKTKEKPIEGKAKLVERDPNNGDMFTIEGLTDAQLARIARNPAFIADYNHLVSPQSPAGQGGEAWVSEMVKRLKTTPEAFKKRPIRDYLEY